MDSRVTRAPQQSRYYAPGERIAGKYELIRPLGEGGMGTVWVARNVALETDVALKLIRAEVDFEDAGDRLLQEARAAARLGHRAICRVFDFGYTEQGDPFIVMELLHGESLASLLQARGRISATKAVQILLPVVDALAVAHKRGIVHRDLKPENIFIAREGDRSQPKIVDFGIAKMESALGPERTLTRQGMVLGSPGYMSPEQARGETNVDFRADIWAISVVLYEAVTGQAAFEGENYNGLMRAIIEQDPPSVVSLSAGDAELDRIIERGLKKVAAERWASMGELAAALANWLDSHGITHDLTGDGLGRWLAPAGEADGDLLSGPPVSRDSDPARRVTPASFNTLPGPRVPRASVSPESTVAVVSSGLFSKRGTPRSTLVLGACALLGIVVGAAAVLGADDEPADTAPVSVGAASVVPPAAAPLQFAAEAPGPPAAVSAPSPSSVPPEGAVAAKGSPDEVTSPTARSPQAPRRAVAPKKVAPAPERAMAPAPPAPRRDLKDPY